MGLAVAWDATTISTMSGVVLAVGVIVGGVIGLVRWIKTLGAAGQRLTDSLDRNTKATGELSDRFDHFATQVKDQLTDHEIRITRVSDRVEVVEGRVARVEGKVDGTGRAPS